MRKILNLIEIKVQTKLFKLMSNIHKIYYPKLVVKWFQWEQKNEISFKGHDDIIVSKRKKPY